MKNWIAVAVLVGVLVCTPACVTGPWQLSRSWDDHYNQKYTESPWIHGVLFNNILPFYLFVGLLASLGDMIAVNTYHFWTHDAFVSGTGFLHDQVEGAGKTVTSPY